MQTTIYKNTFKGCTSLKEIILPSSISAIDDSAFQGCTSLQKASIGSKVTFIGTSAFYGDSSLSNVDRFNDSNSGHTFDIVGNYAFAGTALSSANLSLRSSAIQTFWGDGVFEDCKKLKYVHFLSANYMSKDMFKGCNKLESVDYDVNLMAYTYPGVFDGCSTLTSIMLPSQLLFISEDMFKDCTQLKEMKFNSYDAEKSGVNLIQKNAFNNDRRLTNVNVPTGITSLTQIDDAALSNCAIKNIIFHGIDSDKIFTENLDLDFLDQDIMYGKVLRFAARNSSDANKFKQLLKYAKSKRFQNFCVLVNQSWFSGYIDGEQYYNQTSPLSYSDFQEFASTKKGIFVWVDDYLPDDLSDVYNEYGELYATPELVQNGRIGLQYERNIAKNTSEGISSDIILILSTDAPLTGNNILAMKNLYSMSCDASLYQWMYLGQFEISRKGSCISGISSISTLSNISYFNDMDTLLSGPTICKAKYEFDEHIMQTGMYRLCRDCIVKTADGLSAPFTYDSSQVCSYVEPIIYKSDTSTDTNFSVGKWYYNSEQLCAWAREHNTPCLFIYSLLGCGPCQIYQSYLQNNASFQDWFSKQKFYLCGIECQSQPFYDKSLKFCVDVLSPSAKNFAQTEKGESFEDTPTNALRQKFKSYLTDDGRPASTLMTPVLVFMDKNGICYDYTYHSIEDTISHFGVNGAIQQLKSLCLYHFQNNELNGDVVLSAGEVFNVDDWTYNTENPWQQGTNILNLSRNNVSTPDEAIADIKRQLRRKNHDFSQNSDAAYLGGCLFSDIDYLNATYGGQLDYVTDVNELNEQLGLYYFKIGVYYYIMQLDSNDYQDILNPCMPGTQTYIYKVQFNLVDSSIVTM